MSRQTTLPEGEEKKQFVREMFDRIAKRYDLMNFILTFGLDNGWRKKALKAIGLDKNIAPDRNFLIADLACGTGDFLCQIKGQAAVGFDFSKKMLRVAQARTQKNRAHQKNPTQLVCADITQLPIPDATFSAATMGFALRNLTDIPQALQEIFRILKPSARLAILEVSTPQNLILRKAHALYFRTIVPLIGRLLSDAAAYNYLPRSVDYLPPTHELQAILRNANFTQVEIRPLSTGAVALITATKGV